MSNIGNTAHKIPTGDQGQRYEVKAKFKGKKVEETVGYTNQSSGGGIMRMLMSWPRVVDGSIRVVDRFPGIEELIHFDKFKAGCRRCVSEVYAGREACRCCATVFPLKEDRNGRKSN